VAFAAGTTSARAVRSGTLSGEPGNAVLLLSQIPAAREWERFKANIVVLEDLSRRGLVKAAYPVGPGGIAATLAVMAFGNMTGLEVYAEALPPAEAEGCAYQGSVLVELAGEPAIKGGIIVARTLATALPEEPVYRVIREGQPVPPDGEEDPRENLVAEVPLAMLRRAYEYPLAQVYPQTSGGAAVVGDDRVITVEFRRKGPRKTPRVRPGGLTHDNPSGEPRSNLNGKPWGKPCGKPWGKPLVVLPVFPGTNCEWDMEKAFRKAGGRTRLVVFRNRNREDIREATAELAAAIREAQIIALSGGFSAGDEPDGSGKFIANVFRAPVVADAVTSLLEERDGLVLGICNGFQALIKLGLVPYGCYRAADETMPALTYNRLGRHISRMVRTRVMSDLSPWLALEEPGATHVIPISHGEGRLVVRKAEAEALFRAGQVPFCYADEQGAPVYSEPDNPNGSDFAIEALSSPDGRVLGKMGHSERCGEYVHINIPGNKQQRIFEAGIRYFT
jgi:phosphoribosylformylglycinamidine synthase